MKLLFDANDSLTSAYLIALMASCIQRWVNKEVYKTQLPPLSFAQFWRAILAAEGPVTLTIFTSQV